MRVCSCCADRGALPQMVQRDVLRLEQGILRSVAILPEVKGGEEEEGE